MAGKRQLVTAPLINYCCLVQSFLEIIKCKEDLPMITRKHASLVMIVPLLFKLLQAAEKETANGYINAIYHKNMAEAMVIWRLYQEKLQKTEPAAYINTELVITEHYMLRKRKGDSFDYSLPCVTQDERTEINIRGYKIVDIVGGGIEGKVVKCMDMHNNKLVAIKIADRYNNVEEHNTLKDLHSPYIVSTIEHFNCISDIMSMRFFHVMEYVEGETLEQKMQNDLACNLDTWGDIIMQLVKALIVIREVGHCHGDVKAENVIITPDNRLKLVDFGRAKHIGHSNDDDSLSLAAVIFQLLDSHRRNLRCNHDIRGVIEESDIDESLKKTLLRLTNGEKCYEDVAACIGKSSSTFSPTSAVLK